MKLDRAVVRAVGSDLTDDMKNQVLRQYVVAQAVTHAYLDRRRNLEPGFAGQKQGCGFGPVNPGREAVQRTVGAGMRVTADDERAGPREAFLNHDLMADAFADVEEVLHTVLLHELADELMISRSLFIGCRNHVVEHDYRQVRIAETVFSKVGLDLVRNRRRIVVH